jgi:hypothetical protein
MVKEIRITDDEQHIPREIVIKVRFNHFYFLLKICFFRQQQQNYWIY